MAISLVKGSNVNLTKEAPSLKKVLLDWDGMQESQQAQAST
jgi:stress response protein SCP2